MASLEVLAGDFLKGAGSLTSTTIRLKTNDHAFLGEEFPLTDLDTVEIATEESVKRVGGTVGWGVAGGLLLGPVGLLAGLLLGGRGKDVTFVARFKDGRKLLGKADAKTYAKLLAAVF